MSSSVREWIRRALQASVVAPLALTGCGPDLKGATPFACVDSQPALTGLTLPVIPDVMELRSVSNRGQQGAEQWTTSSRVGEVCATATDKPACETAFAALAPDGGFAAECGQLCVDYHLATTRGDTVAAIASLEALKTFLGPIDTPQEAMLIAFANTYRVSCDQPDRGAAKPDGDGWSVYATTGYACGPGTAVVRHYLRVGADGAISEERSEVLERGDPGCAIGRRPAGLSSTGATGCDEVLGRHFAELAHLEAASVPAFEQLHGELLRHGAPRALCDEAKRSVLDELHHTQLMAQTARRFGAEPRAPEVTPTPPRSLVALACDNAGEGCVRETYGALVAQYQARHAEDADVRARLAIIAEDETRHAQLSWDLDDWAQRRLSENERAAVRAARRQALETLREEVLRAPDAQVARVAGLPPPHVARAMVESLFAEVC